MNTALGAQGTETVRAVSGGARPPVQVVGAALYSHLGRYPLRSAPWLYVVAASRRQRDCGSKKSNTSYLPALEIQCPEWPKTAEDHSVLTRELPKSPLPKAIQLWVACCASRVLAFLPVQPSFSASYSSISGNPVRPVSRASAPSHLLQSFTIGEKGGEGGVTYLGTYLVVQLRMERKDHKAIPLPPNTNPGPRVSSDNIRKQNITEIDRNGRHSVVHFRVPNLSFPAYSKLTQ